MYKNTYSNVPAVIKVENSDEGDTSENESGLQCICVGGGELGATVPQTIVDSA
jgi:hypothetical protein